MKNSWAALGAISLCALAPLQHAGAASAQTEQAMTMIRAACGLANTTLDIQPTPEGRLELRIALANGQRRAMTLVNRDLDAFTDSATLAITRAPLQLASCMDPYIQDITAALAQLPDRPAPAPAPAAPAFVPPTLAPAAPPPAPPRPALPATGDMPVGAVLGTSPAPAAMAPRPGEVSFRVSGCRAAGRDVICDIKVANESNADSRVIVQGSYTKLYGADGSAIQASWVLMGNQRDDVRYGTHQSVMKVIADTSPVLNVVFHQVPEILTSIKRLEVSVGPQTNSGVDLQKITLADVPIQGR